MARAAGLDQIINSPRSAEAKLHTGRPSRPAIKVAGTLPRPKPTSRDGGPLHVASPITSRSMAAMQPAHASGSGLTIASGSR
ncbi:hypothetical protein [Bradyrhizobium sp. STM 3809]|uniref:hypothetical protein n=1 Tax=Bradyrhizobium sp. STM 3809 TaxID=551936 RepID=UPI000559930A|nr:hypothetical protein [Bradyrhizobium sp. STM 3809]